jgi:3-dehydroquinate synthase
MSASFKIATSTGSYAVTVERKLFDRVLIESGDRVYIADDFFAPIFTARGIDAIMLTANEHTKSLDRMTDVICALRERGVTRKTRLIAVGGGVVQDVAAFASAIYMRGIEWVYLPTTLLSMADSCIGGKSSINVGKYKNIVGTIVQPLEVLIDPDFALTLSPEQKAEGLCEAAKICLCKGLSAFSDYMALNPNINSDSVELERVIEHALAQKAWFIEIDEFDRAERLVLNFGHAIEAASNFAISHGIGVGLGMLAAQHLGEILGRDYRKLPEIAQFRAHIESLISAAPHVRDVLSRLDTAALMDAFVSDKKHSRTEYIAIVLTEAGSVERLPIARDESGTRAIENAFAAMLAHYAYAVA